MRRIRLAALAGPASAREGAGSAVTADQYDDSVSHFGAGDPPGSLPFTGLDVALMGVAAAALLATGSSSAGEPPPGTRPEMSIRELLRAASGFARRRGPGPWARFEPRA